MAFPLDYWVLFAIWCAAMPVGAYAFLHALLQRADAYTAADRMTKTAWSLITGGGLAALLLFRPQSSTFILWMAALVAVLVYIVDVRPKLNEVQRGNRW
ncbi:DUF2516 family protein [Kutzneria buriramensis]|uniref:Uncharacterized protein DUF2516 n=1 Tax=Kutzneria buriramensis TaxID=1045776 RepID=A0A3E0I985_9PSEU|nr:DUF2516 family protein [Kutzneria buriramensis]REH55298.1 uncharacterized protein DUF2516 [Kutzneria buriramensis]